ncbi:hypothetical protein [Deinococcus ficus]|uniref:hypothetical protein n=1 Tax=Deinococcus ficus TaxID=317577 RepID=UPI00308437F1
MLVANARPLPDLTLRDRSEADLPIPWHWCHAERSPEWQQWDTPYVHGATRPLPYEAFLDRQRVVEAGHRHLRPTALEWRARHARPAPVDRGDLRGH